MNKFKRLRETKREHSGSSRSEYSPAKKIGVKSNL